MTSTLFLYPAMYREHQIRPKAPTAAKKQAKSIIKPSKIGCAVATQQDSPSRSAAPIQSPKQSVIKVRKRSIKDLWWLFIGVSMHCFSSLSRIFLKNKSFIICPFCHLSGVVKTSFFVMMKKWAAKRLQYKKYNI